MSDKFRLGQPTRIFQTSSHPRLINERGTITGRNWPRLFRDGNVGGWVFAHRYLWLCDADGITYRVQEACLAPIYDGDLAVSWEDCAWRPMKKEAPKVKEEQKGEVR